MKTMSREYAKIVEQVEALFVEASEELTYGPKQKQNEARIRKEAFGQVLVYLEDLSADERS